MKSVVRAGAALVAAVSLVVLGLVAAPAAPANAAARPSAKSVSVKTVSTKGGTVVTITGKNLKKVNSVYFGATRTTKLKHLGTTKLRVTAPAHKPGKVSIQLRIGKKKYSTKLTVTYVAPFTPNAFETEVLRLTNLHRVAGYTCVDSASGEQAVMPAVAALTWDNKLADAARKHSADMGAKKYFSHTSPDGTTFSARITKAGYVWSAVGENIAGGFSTPAAVVDAWMGSYGHCQNIMSSAFTQLGVGYAAVAGSPYIDYWTQDFGTPR